MIKNINIYKICIVLLMFMYIFMFRIGFIDSGMLAGVIVAILVLLNKKARRRLSQLINAKRFQHIFILYCSIIVWIVVSTTINKSFDYSFLKTWVHVLIQLVIGVLFYCYLYAKNDSKNITNYIILVFILQTVIEWAGFISPAFKNFIFSTKDAGTIIIADRYSGIRGLSLAGSSFFGLAIAFGLIYILFFSDRNTLFIGHPILKFFAFIFLITGSFSAGRTGLVGAAIGIAYFMYKFITGKVKIKATTILTVVSFMIIAVVGFSLIAQNINSTNPLIQKIGYMYDYVFEGIISFFNTGKFSTSSSSELFNDMYFRISIKTTFIGDGQYTDSLTNGYYMNTDSGYMRVILYGGVPLLLLMILFQNSIIKLDIQNRKNKIAFFIWILMLVGQIKGEVVGFTLILFSMLLLYSLQGMERQEDKVHSKMVSKIYYERGVVKC